jgi:RNA polymerase sigma-70 factor (ECF subfamily)
VREGTSAKEIELLARLRAGDEMAFASLVDDLHGPLLALARTFTSSRSLAEDIVQETWVAVIRGLPRFEERSALRTWIYGILVRRARSLAARVARERLVAASGDAGTTGARATGSAIEWRLGGGRRGLWEEAPVPWALDDPAAIQEGEEALQVVARALEALPESQRRVVRLRDVEGLPARDVCNILHVSETNQRVLLHRGRAAVRRALDRYVREGIGLRSLGAAIGVAGSMMGGGS